MTLSTEAPAQPAGSQATQREALFSAMVDRQARFLYRVAFSLLKNQQDAEDAVQETFMKLYRGTAWLSMDDERAFLARSVWRVGLDRIGTASARAMRHSEDVASLDLRSPADTPEQHALANAERNHMKHLVNNLPEDLRRPLVLAAIEGMRSREVAVLLGIPEGTVRTRIMRAKAQLRQRFLAADPSRTEAHT